MADQTDAEQLLDALSDAHGWWLTNTERLTLAAAFHGFTRTQISTTAARRKTRDNGTLTPAALVQALHRNRLVEPPVIAPHSPLPPRSGRYVELGRAGIAQARAALAAHTEPPKASNHDERIAS